MQERIISQLEAARQEVESTGSRSERIRTYNFEQDRVSDHRLSGSMHGIPRMMEGELLLVTKVKLETV